MSALITPTGLKVEVASATSLDVSWDSGAPNLVPSDATYSAGAYTVTGLTPGKRYVWVKGTDEEQLTNGAYVYTNLTNHVATDAAWNGGTVYFTASQSSVVIAGSGVGAVLGTVREVDHNLDVFGDGSATVNESDGYQRMYGGKVFLGGIMFRPRQGVNLRVRFYDDGTVTTDAATISTVGNVDLTIKINPGVTRVITILNALQAHSFASNPFTALIGTGTQGTGTTSNFEVWRDGVLVQTVSSATLSWTDTGRSQLTFYSYQVRAIDANNNASEFSAKAGGLTPSSTSNPGFPVEFGGDGRHFARTVVVDGSGNVFASGYFDRSRNIMTFLVKFDTNGNLIWSRVFPGGSGGHIGLLSAGEIILAGTFSGTIDFGSGPITSGAERDRFIAKFSSTGILQRMIVLQSPIGSGNAGDEEFQGIAIDSANNVIVCGYRNHGQGLSPFVLKYSSDLAVIWTKMFSHGSDVNHIRVAIDGSNNILVAGQFGSTIDLGGGVMTSNPGSADIFVGKLSGTDGSNIWQRQAGDVYADVVRGLAVDSAGNAIVTGMFFVQSDMGGGTIGEGTRWEIFVAKYAAATGNHIWSKSFGVYSTGTSTAIIVGDSDAVFVSGLNLGPITFAGASHNGIPGAEWGFVVKYSSAGVEQSLTSGGTGLFAADTAPSSKVVITGKGTTNLAYVQRVDQ